MNLTRLKIFLITLSCFLLSIGKTHAQTFTFNLQTSPLVFEYSTIENFTGPRTITKAFTLDVQNSRIGKYNVYCKIVSNTNQNIANVPLNLFNVKLNSANFNLLGSYYLPNTIGLNDIKICDVTNRAKQNDIIFFDLILNPLGLNFNPDNYGYSFIFTVSEY